MPIGVSPRLRPSRSANAAHPVATEPRECTGSPPFGRRHSEPDLVAALEREDLARFVRAGELEPEALDDLASLPGPIHSESSSPTRTLPPMAAAMAAIGIWLRPAPSTDQ